MLRAPSTAAVDEVEWYRNRLVIWALGLGLEQTFSYLGRERPTLEEFEAWVVRTAGTPDPRAVARIDAAVTGQPYPEEIARWLAEVDEAPPVLDGDALASWERNGYVVVPDAVAPESRDTAAAAILSFVGAREDDPDSWYGTEHRSGIMVPLWQAPGFAENRRSARIHKAFAQLWGTADLWVTADRGGFNPPVRPGALFHGPDLHWDTSLVSPVPFSAQGILYLTDTPAEQGAFTCVPGFHLRLEEWLASLPAGADPRREDLHALGSVPIPGRAGDLVIWHDALPHGSRPNLGARPRVVQYVSMVPTAAPPPRPWC